MSKRTCSIPDCFRVHKARGFCSSHYNSAFYPDRHKKVVVRECAGCGRLVEKLASTSSIRRAVCSYRCRSFLQNGRWPEEGKQVVGPVARLSIPLAVRIARAARFESQPSVAGRFVSGRCAWCDGWFTAVTTHIARLCSSRCTSRYADFKYGGHTSNWIVPRRRMAIYERDDWVCQLCFEPVDQDVHYLDDWAPSLDHIVPRSLGGGHESENLRLAHRWCNAVLGDGSRYSEEFFAA